MTTDIQKVMLKKEKGKVSLALFYALIIIKVVTLLHLLAVLLLFKRLCVSQHSLFFFSKSPPLFGKSHIVVLKIFAIDFCHKKMPHLKEDSFVKQYNYSNYRNLDEWEKYLNEKIEEYNFFIRAIEKDVLNRIACLHHYQKTESGEYISIASDPFWRDPNRYIQTF